jgi:hypothetical protein
MSGFSVEWLALREGYDVRARNPEVLGAVTSLLKPKGAANLIDLACGAGSTLRTLSPLLPPRQHWDLVDNDPALLHAASRANVSDDISLDTVQIDLAGDFEAVLDRPCDLVTISALLDLVSEDWLDRFARSVAARKLPVYAALTYDGRIVLSPPDPADAAIIAAVNAHQRTDKGLGPALGPSGAIAAISRFEELGYRVVHGTSDWTMEAADQAMQIELLDGWAAAAREMNALPGAEVNAWLNRRKALAAQRASAMRVGHVDFFATPSTMR